MRLNEEGRKASKGEIHKRNTRLETERKRNMRGRAEDCRKRREQESN